MKVSGPEEKVIEFVSKKLPSGKRIHELELLKRLLTYRSGLPGLLKNSLNHNYRIARYQSNYSNRYRDTNLVLYRKYAYEDVQNFLNAGQRGIKVELFVRKNKDDKISKEFYYLGRMKATGQVREFVLVNTNKTAVEIEWVLDTPVRKDIYDYIVKG